MLARMPAMPLRRATRVALIAAVLLSSVPARAAGGHHAVDAYGGDDAGRHGVAADWTPGGGAWTMAAERYRQEGGHFVRIGLRWSVAKDWQLDLSRAAHLRGAGESSWTAGLKREFDR